ncbi:MAG TPA: ABC transporter ATP-binding protein [Vicinamibacterales bacterium]|nr:ABC transporter ATP-binding protein [Vicinamibacterales bacterium]
MLELEDVHVGYGPIEALHGISLRVEFGTIVALIGSNGAGKSTTLRTISGLLVPRTGRITFEGKSIHGRPPHSILGLGIAHVPEGRQIFPNLTVWENLRLGAFGTRGTDHVMARLETVFQQFPVLRERAKQLGGTLSGGEQQMLAIGRALMTEPRLLMLDEPSLGLAPLYVQRVIDIVRALNAGGMTILLVEQRAQAALGIAEQAYVLETGRIVLADSGARLLENEELKRAYLGI